MQKIVIVSLLSMLVCDMPFLASDRFFLSSFSTIPDGNIAACMQLLKAKEKLLWIPQKQKGFVRIKGADKGSHKIRNHIFKDCASLDHQLAHLLMRVNKEWYKKVIDHREKIVTQFNAEWQQHNFFKLCGWKKKKSSSPIHPCDEEDEDNNCIDLDKKPEKFLKLYSKDDDSIVYIHPATVQFDASGNCASGYALDLMDSVYFDEHGQYLENPRYDQGYIKPRYWYAERMQYNKVMLGDALSEVEYVYYKHKDTPYAYYFHYPTCIIESCRPASREGHIDGRRRDRSYPRVMYGAATNIQRNVLLFLTTTFDSYNLNAFMQKKSDSSDEYLTVRGWHTTMNTKAERNVEGFVSHSNSVSIITSGYEPISTYPLYEKTEREQKLCWKVTYEGTFNVDGTYTLQSNDKQDGIIAFTAEHLRTWHGAHSDLGTLEKRREECFAKKKRLYEEECKNDPKESDEPAEGCPQQ